MSVIVRFLAAGFAATIALSSFQANAAQFNRTDSITIRNNSGGKMLVYSLRAKKLARQGRGVRFAGRCESACTMYLSMPNKLTCIMPGASFGFHLPHGASRRDNLVAANYMMNSYPRWVRSWIQTQRGLSRSMKRMPYAYASRYLQPCPARGRPSTRVTRLVRDEFSR